jgi:poly(beta-D-mannuronate) lyase
MGKQISYRFSSAKIIGCSGLFALLAFTAPAAEYTVGSAAEISALSPVAGDVILLKSGEWIGQRIVLNFNGTEANPVIVRAASPGKTIFLTTASIEINGDYIEVSGLVFTGESPTKNTAVTFTQNAAYSRLYDTAIVGFNPTEQTSIHTWVNIYGTDNRVDHCLFEGKVHAGQTVRVRRDANRNDRHRIDHNYFLDRVPLGINGGETIQIGLSQTQFTDSLTTVEYNRFEHLDGEIEIISVKSGGNVLRYNTIVECGGLFTLRHGDGSTIESNFFLCNKKATAGGVRIYGKNHRILNNYIYGAEGTSTTRGGISIHSGDDVPSTVNPSGTVAAENCLIAFNTLVDCDRSFNYGNGHVVPPKDITLANNIVSTTASSIIQVSEAIINPIYEGNIFSGPALGIEPLSEIITVDPLLVKDDEGVFRPSTLSPAIDGARGSYPAVVQDVDGQSRKDGFADVGADEVSTETVLNRPLNPNHVGPSWILGYPYVPIPPESPNYQGAFIETEGNLMMEAEHFSESEAVAGNQWDPIFVSGATGASSINAIQVPSNTAGALLVGSARVDYTIEVSQPGNYFIHVLGFGPTSASNSIYVGLNQSTLDVQTVHLPELLFGWRSAPLPFTLPAGRQKLSLWVREAGAFVDRIFLSTGTTPPNNAGGDESARNLDLFELWRAHYFGEANPDIDDDSDGDGLPLLIEYALGADPEASTQAELPALRLEAGILHFSFPRNANLSEITYRVRSAATPDQWNTTLYDSSVNMAPNNAGTHMDVTTPLPSSGGLFLILEATIKDR